MARNTIKTIYAWMAMVAAILILALVMIASCGPYSSFSARDRSQIPGYDRPPLGAFALIFVEIEITPAVCLPPTTEEECELIVMNLPSIKQVHSGSGLNLWYKGKELIVTAAHVCTEDVPDAFEHAGIKFTVLQKTTVDVMSVSGKKYRAEVVGLDDDADICALKIEGKFSDDPPVKLSESPLRMGDRVYAVAAPYGLGGKNLALVFTGFYSGVRDGKHFYTIPTRPGSSGSIVLNEDWEAVGNLHTAYVPLEHVGIGAGWKDLRDFLESVQLED
tara:strand:- start:2653 stop:3477 length:825 start_codon:yes stop_codon:yes gene_type:complete